MHRVIGDQGLEASPFSPGEARAMLADMLLARRFDERALALQRRGWMSGYPPFRGQEASQVGAAHAMADGDWLVPTYRQNALQLARGVPASDLLLFRRGFPEFHSDHDLRVFPQSVPIATQIPIATGIGMAARARGTDEAVLACFGDGATSEGDFHEGLNFAGVFDAPVVFLCENNGWAISLPRERQTASESIAVKAEAYGLSGVRVDGNDPLAVREVVAEALERARGGEPTLVESLTYRQGAHTTADEPDRYRDEEPDMPDWRIADPVERFEAHLREAGAVDDEFVEAARETAEEMLAEAVEEAESVALEGPGTIFDSVYETPTPPLRAQRAWLEAFAAEHDLQHLEY